MSESPIPAQFNAQQFREMTEKQARSLLEDVVTAIGLPLSVDKILQNMEEQGSADSLKDVAKSSLLWEGLNDCARVRCLGSAGLGESANNSYGQPHDGYAHIGLEFWTTYAGTKSQMEESWESSRASRRKLFHFAAISAIVSTTKDPWQRQRVLAPAGT